MYDNDSLISGYETFGHYFDKMLKLRTEFPKNALVTHLCSSVHGHVGHLNVRYRTYDDIISEKLEVGLSEKYDFIEVGMSSRIDDSGNLIDIYELLDSKQPYSLNVRLTAFLTAYGRNKLARLAMKDIDHCIRCYVDCCVFTKEQTFDRKLDAVLDITTIKLENKTTGLIKFTKQSYEKVTL